MKEGVAIMGQNWTDAISIGPILAQYGLFTGNPSP